MTVLIVEDNQAMREAIAGTIGRDNNTFIELNDGLDALKYYEIYHPDLVIMDIKMKKLNGLIAAKNITGSFPDAKIIILTGFNSKTYRHEAEKAGASAYLLKKDLYELKNITTKKIFNLNEKK